MPDFKVLLFQEMHSVGTELLREKAEVIVAPSADEETLLPLVKDIDGVVVRAVGRMSERLIANAPKLKVIGRHGVGLDNIDVETATKRGIWVVSTPGVNAEAVAEHTVGMMIVLSKKIFELDGELRDGRWDARYRYMGEEIGGKTLGIVGLGRIGRRLAEICKYGFGMKLLYNDKVRFPDLEERLECRFLPLDELLREADYVSLHVPLTSETYHLIGARELKMMKKGAYLVNTARGSVVDEEALVEVLREGHLGGAGLDVFEEQPLPLDNPLLRMKNVIVTPHAAALTEEAMMAMSLVAEDILRVLEGKRPKYPVNEPRREEI